MMAHKKIICFFFFIMLMGTAFSFAHSTTPTALIMNASNKRASARTVADLRGPLIVLDAGHGGSDEGAKVQSVQEKKITLATVLYTKKYLEEMGYRVILTRGKDAYVSLPKRVSIANKTKSALFVSVHFNASRNSAAEGIEIYYYSNKDPQRARSSRRLANYVLHFVLDQTEAVSRGVKSGNFHVIRETSMPAILIEGGFMTNRSEWLNLKKRSYLENIAKGIAHGIDKYLKS
jgi:N-acetylmuramoyl-L-alanine amidase